MTKFTTALYAAALLAASTGSLALAQTEDPCKNPTYKQCYQGLPVRTLAIDNARQQGDANEIVAALRNILPAESKVYLVESQNAIVVRAMPDDLTLAQKLISELDKPKKTFRLTYTVTEVDGTKRIGSQRFAMILIDGQRTTLNQGSRVPVPSGNGSNQFTYMDVGTNFEATLNATGTGAKLNSKVTQSSFVAATSGDASQQPIVRNLTLEGSSMLVPTKPVALGSMDVPGSTRHLEVEAVMENLP